MHFVLTWVATPAASIIAGLIALFSLIYSGRHRDKAGKTLPAKIVFSMIQGAALYTFVLIFALHWTGFIQLAEVIKDGFGQDRFSYLLLGVILDVAGKMYALFDPD